MRKTSKLLTLLLAAGMVWSLATPSTASAVDVKFSGTMDFSFERADTAIQSVRGVNQFNAMQRLRLAMEFVASENLSAYYMLQVGTGLWGASSTDSTYGQDFSGGHQSKVGRARISTRFMYVDWIVPNTQVKVRMGKQAFGLPGFAFNTSPITGGVQPGISVSAPINDTFAINAFWQRPSANDTDYPKANESRFRNLDIFGVAVPMKFSGFNFAPYVQVASAGSTNMSYGGGSGSFNPGLQGRLDSSVGTSFAWWAGFASQLTMFDPFTVSLDFAYGAKDGSNKGRLDYVKMNNDTGSVSASKLGDRSGWMAALKMDYKTAYGVPTLLTWYGSGDGKDQAKGSGMMPFTVGDQSPSIGTAATWFNTAWGLEGSDVNSQQISGTWGVSLQWNKFSFVEDLFHDFSVTYFQGTNNKANVYTAANPNREYRTVNGTPFGGYKAGNSLATTFAYMTTKDSAVDINLTSTYAIYKNLAANLELGYMFTNFDENIRATAFDANGNPTAKPKFDNIWRVAVNFRYTF